MNKRGKNFAKPFGETKIKNIAFKCTYLCKFRVIQNLSKKKYTFQCTQKKNAKNNQPFLNLYFVCKENKKKFIDIWCSKLKKKKIKIYIPRVKSEKKISRGTFRNECIHSNKDTFFDDNEEKKI